MKTLDWVPPCGCKLRMSYETNQEDVWSNDPTKTKLVDYRRNGKLFKTERCGSHENVPLEKLRDSCWNECKKISEALRNLEQINPDIIEKIPTVSGEIQRYRDGITPIRYEDCEWEGEGENRVAHIKINPEFRKGIIKNNDIIQLKSRIERNDLKIERLME